MNISDIVKIQVLREGLSTLLADLLMHLALYLFTITEIALYVTYIITGKVGICEMMAVLGVSIVIFVIVRGEFMVHRPAGYVSYVETFATTDEDADTPKDNQGNPLLTYEAWKRTLKNTWILAACDIIGSMILLFTIYKADKALWLHGDYEFVLISAALTLVAALCVPLVPRYAGK